MSAELPETLLPKAEGLGEFQREFTVGSDFHRRSVILVAGLFVLLAGIGAGLFVIARDTNQIIIAAIFGSIAFPFLVILTVILLKHGRRVLVFANGFVSIRRKKVFSCRWDEIASVRESMSKVDNPRGEFHLALQLSCFLSQEHWLIVKRRDGKEIRLDGHIRDIQDLGNILQSEAMARLLPRAVEALKQGRPVGFGPVRLTPEGLDTGNEALGWDKVESVLLGPDMPVESQHMTFSTSILTIRKRGMKNDWFSRAFGDIPNALVLLALLNSSN